MADGVFNVAKGRVNELVTRVADSDPATSGLVLVLLQTAEADGSLQDRDTLFDLLEVANTEADFTNYVRIVLDSSEVVAPEPDHTENAQYAQIDNQTWSSAGGATNNTLTKLLICYDPDTSASDDASIVPLCFFDYVATTDGSNLIVQFDESGFYKAE